ncbi:MAG: hypothetical protein ACRDY6_03610 [Acidimicrobiia bacterium]
MAKALQCPACGNKHPLSGLPNSATFRCERCGRMLKVPAQFRPRPAGRAQTNGPAGETTTMPPQGRRAAVPAPAPESAPPPRRRADGAGPGKVAWPFRVLAWLIALPLGLIAVVIPARRLGFLSGQRLLDVIVGIGWSRYWRVLVIAPAWALVTTLLVHLMLFGLRKLGERRQAIRTERLGSERQGSDEPEPAAASGAGRAGRRR